MKTPNSLLARSGTTVFATMSALAARHGAINLGQGFPDTEGPADMVRVAADALLDGRNQYPPLHGLPELRQAVAAAEQRFYGLGCDPQTDVVVTAGASEGLAASLQALLDPGDEVVLLEPLFDTYLPLIRLAGAVPRLVRLQPPAWDLPRAELAAAFGPRTKLMLLNTPMNPTGKVFTAAELAFIAELLQRHDVYAICDEVYEHITLDGCRHIPLMTLPGMRERCLRIGSAGKTFSLTGWKVGYVTGPAPLAELVARAHQNMVFTVPPNLQRAVAFGLGKDDAYFTALASGMTARRERLATGLTAAGFGVLPSQGSYFVIADLAPLGLATDDMAFCRQITQQAGVSAIPVSIFYDADPPRDMVRFAFCKQESVLDEAIQRLGAYLGAEPRLTGRARGG